MACAVALMRSIQAGFDSVFGDVIYLLFVGFFFGSPRPPTLIFHADDPFLRVSRGFCDTVIFQYC